MLVDGVSWRILAEDIKRLYLGESLPSKGSSYRQWVSRICLLYTSPSPRDRQKSRMPSSA